MSSSGIPINDAIALEEMHKALLYIQMQITKLTPIAELAFLVSYFGPRADAELKSARRALEKQARYRADGTL